MVSIRTMHNLPVTQANIKQWLSNFKNRDLITNLEPVVVDYLKIIELHREEYNKLTIDLISLSSEIVEILHGLQVDSEMLIAAFLFPLVDYNIVDISELNHYGNKITKMIKGTIAMAQVENLRQSDQFSSQQQQNIRHMLLSIVDDYRSMIVKIAERIAYLRQLSRINSSAVDRVANQCFKIYTPLANRLGIGNLKWEMEDLCFKILNPEQYHEIKNRLNGKRKQREIYLNSFITELKSKLTNFINGKFEVYGRPKHIYSIYSKMDKKSLKFEELYDLLAVRILVEDVQQCYGVLGLLHTSYRHIPKEFTDYIANQKKNGYQSIHTIIKDQNSNIVEIQIRTYDMHKDAELGVAAHWNYKENNGASNRAEDKVTWLRKLLQSDQDYDEKINEIRDQLFNDRVYIFTPRGDVIDLPVGATPLDFAYAIHSEIGHRCVGAKVNSRMVNFLYELVTGDQVEIITNKNSSPSRDWLNNGFLTTNRARTKITAYFSQQDKEKNLAIGKTIYENKLKQFNFKSNQDLEQDLIKKFKSNGIDELLIGLATGKVKLLSFENYLQNLEEAKNSSAATLADQQILERVGDAPSNTPVKNRNRGMIMCGELDLLYSLAKCCQPIPGDAILGYVTKGRGVTVHRADCTQLSRISHDHNERLLEVHWSNDSYSKTKINANLKLISYNRSGILRDVAQCVSQEKANITNINSKLNAATMMIEYNMELEFINVDTLPMIISKLRAIKDVVEVVRY